METTQSKGFSVMEDIYAIAARSIRKGRTISWRTLEPNSRKIILSKLALHLQDLPQCPECGTRKPYICKMSCDTRMHGRSVFFHVV